VTDVERAVRLGRDVSMALAGAILALPAVGATIAAATSAHRRHRLTAGR
jgi:hypothetical protein